MAVRKRRKVVATKPAGVAKRILAALADYLKQDQTKLSPQDTLRQDLGLDSLEIIELLYELEEGFNLTIPDEDLEKLQTVGDVIHYIEAALEHRSPRATAKSSRRGTKTKARRK